MFRRSPPLLLCGLLLSGCAKENASDAREASGVTKVAGGFQFTEGPVWIAPSGHLLFSDVLGDAIEELTPPSAVAVFRKPSNASNGLAIDRDGWLIACEGGAHRVTRTLADGTVEAIATSFGGKSLNSPNDVIAAADGTIYFTDPDLGKANPNDKQPFSGVFRILPDKSIALVSSDMQSPNGIALSPDGQTLYVGDSAQNYLRQYVLHPDGSAEPPTKLVDTAPMPDGFTVDDLGSLYVATAAGIQIFGADGALHRTIAVPELPSNCAFGGPGRRTLFITARSSLYQVTLTIPGKP